MNEVNKTLFIPLYGKALVHNRGMILHDPWAAEIWPKAGLTLGGKSSSKWLAYYMAMRAAVFDRWVNQKMEEDPDALVVHIGCGLDSRVRRVGLNGHRWIDLDFPSVIEVRREYYSEEPDYEMLDCDFTDLRWLNGLPKTNAILVMEGVSMYIPPRQLKQTLDGICGHFQRTQLLMDCYSTFAAKASAWKNPINEVGVTRVYGMDDPRSLEGERLRWLSQLEMTPDDLIETLPASERRIFSRLYAGGFAKKLYRLYEYTSG